MSNYWLKREEEALKHYITDEKEYSKHIEKIYRNMMDACQKEIEAFYGKYAKDENISMSEAKKRVSGLDVEAFGRKAKKYVEEKNFSAQANKELKLYNATMKINRLEMLKANIGLELISGFDELNDYMGQILKDRALEELERQAGILGESISDNVKLADSIVNSSFHNATFSDRLWQYQSVMRSDLSKLIESGLIQGKSARVLAREIRKYYIGSGKLKNGRNGAIYSSERLMRTELARVQIEAQKKSFEANDFDEYIFLANSTCCSECRKMHNKHFKVKKMMPGVNAPPMHPHCRCSTAAYIAEEGTEQRLSALNGTGESTGRNLLRNARFKTGELSTNEYIEQTRVQNKHSKVDITQEWLKGSSGTGNYSVAGKVKVDGKDYYVDGKRVVVKENSKEKAVAECLSSKYGFNVVRLPEIKVPQNIQMADYLIDNVKYDVKSPTGSGKNTLDGLIKHKSKQSSNFIFDLSDCPLTDDEVEQQITRIYASDNRMFVDIIVLYSKNEIIKVFKRKK